MPSYENLSIRMCISLVLNSWYDLVCYWIVRREESSVNKDASGKILVVNSVKINIIDPISDVLGSSKGNDYLVILRIVCDIWKDPCATIFNPCSGGNSFNLVTNVTAIPVVDIWCRTIAGFRIIRSFLAKTWIVCSNDAANNSKSRKKSCVSHINYNIRKYP